MSQNIQSLSTQYNTILTQYKQTYQYYLQSLQQQVDNSGNIFVTVPNAAFWGESPINTNTMNTSNDCVNSCSTTLSCSGATYNTSNQLCYLRKGNGSIIPSSSSETAIVTSSLQYSYQLKNLNQKLLHLNKEMESSLQTSYIDYKNSTQEQQQKTIVITQNNAILKEDREKIDQMIREEELMNAAGQNSQIAVTQFYSVYVVYLLVTILIIVLLINFSIFNMGSANQRGGWRGFFKKMK